MQVVYQQLWSVHYNMVHDLHTGWLETQQLCRSNIFDIMAVQVLHTFHILFIQGVPRNVLFVVGGDI